MLDADNDFVTPSAKNLDKPKVVLLKILGVTTPWSYARKTLVKYSLEKCKDYIFRSFDEEHMNKLIEAIIVQNGRQKVEGLPVPIISDKSTIDMNTHKNEIATYVSHCIANDRFKFGTPINDLQSYIWGEGYLNGSLKADLYPEVFESIKEWKSKNIKVYTFSSGKVEGQRLYFANSVIGDISKYIDGHISSSNLSMSDKYDTGCYAKISHITGEERNLILFLTNSTAEAKAAAISGIPVCLVQREGNNCINEDESRYFVKIEKFTELSFKSL